MKLLLKNFLLKAVGGSPFGGSIQQCVWSGVFSYRGQFSVLVEEGASVLQPDLEQEVVAEGRCSQVLLALPSWELLSMLNERVGGDVW